MPTTKPWTDLLSPIAAPPAVPEEGAREHLRNAEQILGDLLLEGDKDPEPLVYAIAAALRRCERARAQIERGVL